MQGVTRLLFADMEYFPDEKESGSTVQKVISLYASGLPLEKISLECALSAETIRRILRTNGMRPPKEIQQKIRQLLHDGVPVETIASGMDVPIEAVQAIENRKKRKAAMQSRHGENVIALAKKGYSRVRIAEKLGITAGSVQRHVCDLDLFEEQKRSVSSMFDGGMGIDDIAKELGISENRVRGFLRAAGRIAGPEKPLRGFQNPNNYPFRYNGPEK